MRRVKLPLQSAVVLMSLSTKLYTAICSVFLTRPTEPEPDHLGRSGRLRCAQPAGLSGRVS